MKPDALRGTGMRPPTKPTMTFAPFLSIYLRPRTKRMPSKKRLSSIASGSGSLESEVRFIDEPKDLGKPPKLLPVVLQNDGFNFDVHWHSLRNDDTDKRKRHHVVALNERLWDESNNWKSSYEKTLFRKQLSVQEQLNLVRKESSSISGDTKQTIAMKTKKPELTNLGKGGQNVREKRKKLIGFAKVVSAVLRRLIRAAAVFLGERCDWSRTAIPFFAILLLVFVRTERLDYLWHGSRSVLTK